MGKRRARGDDGVSAVELAIIAPSLLALIFFVIQGALYFYGRSVALQAARDGVSQLRLAQNADDCTAIVDSVRSSVQAYAAKVGSGALTDANVDPQCAATYDTADNGPQSVKVTVTGKSISLIGFSISVTESATGRVEEFQDEG